MLKSVMLITAKEVEEMSSRELTELSNLIFDDFKHYKNIDKFNLNGLIEFQLITDMSSSGKNGYCDFMRGRKSRASLCFECEGMRYSLAANYEYV